MPHAFSRVPRTSACWSHPMSSRLADTEPLWRPPTPSWTAVEKLRRFINSKHQLHLGGNGPLQPAYASFTLHSFPDRGLPCAARVLRPIVRLLARHMGVPRDNFVRASRP